VKALRAVSPLGWLVQVRRVRFVQQRVANFDRFIPLLPATSYPSHMSGPPATIYGADFDLGPPVEIKLGPP